MLAMPPKPRPHPYELAPNHQGAPHEANLLWQRPVSRRREPHPVFRPQGLDAHPLSPVYFPDQYDPGATCHVSGLTRRSPSPRYDGTAATMRSEPPDPNDVPGRGSPEAELRVRGIRHSVRDETSQFGKALVLFAGWPHPDRDLGLHPLDPHFAQAVSRVILNWSQNRLWKVSRAVEYLQRHNLVSADLHAWRDHLLTNDHPRRALTAAILVLGAQLPLPCNPTALKTLAPRPRLDRHGPPAL